MKTPINIISKTIYQYTDSGPKKVVKNTVKGFDLLGIPYTVNKHHFYAKYNWIHDDTDAFILLMKEACNEHAFKKLSEQKYFFGPNLFLLPSNILESFFDTNSIQGKKISDIRGLQLGSYSSPSKWTDDLWKNEGFDASINIWPVGVDTDYFTPDIHIVKDNDILLYTKGRSKDDIDEIENYIKSLNLSFSHLSYGSYDEEYFIHEVRRSKFGVVVVSSESQGLAIEEMLSMNLPLVVFDISYINQRSYKDSIKNEENEISEEAQISLKNRHHATSVPYWDDSCGLKSIDIDTVKKYIVQMQNEYEHFHPREFIVNELGLKKQARELCALLGYPLKIDDENNGDDKGQLRNQPYDDIDQITTLTKTLPNWRNRTWYRPILFLKYSLKKIRAVLKL